jgi:hypothetical protein
MNLFGFIGNLLVTAIKSVTNVINLLVGKLEKKFLILQKVRLFQSTKAATSDSNPFSPQNPVPGVDLLAKEGWTKVNVHPLVGLEQQLLILKNEKERKVKVLGKRAFLEYLEELKSKRKQVN